MRIYVFGPKLLSLLRSFILLFLSRPAAEARAPRTTQGQAAPKRPKRKLTKKSSTFLDKSSLKKRNRRGNAISWVEAFKFKNREEYEDSDVYKDKISNLKTHDKGGRPYNIARAPRSRRSTTEVVTMTIKDLRTWRGRRRTTAKRIKELKNYLKWKLGPEISSKILETRI